MRIVEFSDQYETVAELCGMSPEELRQRDRRRPMQRWFALDGPTPIAAATAATRPDKRTFLSFNGDATAYGRLSEAAAGSLSTNLYTTVADADSAQIETLRRAGFETEVTTERFEIAFEAAIAALRRFRVPNGFTLRPAGTVDEGRLFALDNEIRDVVPGLNGWEGNREWFKAELEDPASYIVAIDLSNDVYAGLARMWRNPTGPHFGLVGVAEQYQRARLGPALLNNVVSEAAGWGYPTFTADTGLTNKRVHPRLKRLGATSLGTTSQMMLRFRRSD